MVQAGVPSIGAILRGMDLVFFGNYSGNATKLGSDATLALIAGKDSGIVKGDLKSLKGKKIARLVRHHQSSLHPRPAGEGRARRRPT